MRLFSFKSFTFKLIFIIGLLFLFSVLSLLILVDRQLHSIIDKSQQTLFEGKIQILINDLDTTNERLLRTGLVDAYIDDFQSSFLRNLQDTYYDSPEILQEAPFILDRSFTILSHPVLPAGDRSLQDIFRNLKNPEASASGRGRVAEHREGREKTWYIYKFYSPWGWYIGYSLPYSIKYRDLRLFRNNLIILTSVLSIIVLAVLAFLLLNFTSPIIRLTQIAAKIARGELEHHIEVRNSDEIGLLAGSFDEMQKAVKQKIEDLKCEIAERKKAETALVEAREETGSIINSMPSVIIALDENRRVTQWNDKAEEYFGLKFNDVRGKDLFSVFPEISDFALRIRKDLAAGKIFEEVRSRFSGEGKTLYENVTVYPLFIPSREEGAAVSRGAVIRIDDITEKKKLEQQLSHAMKMEAVGHLAGGVAHDFNNMLTGISGAAQILKLHGAFEKEEDSQYLDMILEASSRAGDLTGKLLSFSRRSDLTDLPIDLSKVLRDTMVLLERTIDKKVRIHVSETAENTVISGEYSDLQNCLLNLALNASHAMPEGGELFLQTRNLTLGESYCRISPFSIEPGEYVELEVRDTGTGISPENLDRIFDPFFTTKSRDKGTGLGLSSVYSSVKNHHGEIRVYSEVGVGTVFHLYLPCIESRGGAEIPGETRRGTGTILFIDDEKLVRLTARPMLEGLGYEVIDVDNGREGIEIYRERKEDIDLVITDMIMPEIDGREVFTALRKIDPDVRVIISSGFTPPDILRELNGKGLSGFIQKPYKQKEFSTLIHKVLTGEE